MNTEIEYVPVPSNLSLSLKKDYRSLIIKRKFHIIYSILWKAILYAFILTIANVVI